MFPKKSPVIPNTYIIGVQKAGTTSLHYWLSQHPQVFGPNNLKDVDILANPAKAEQAVTLFSKALIGHDSEKIILHSQVNYILYKQSLAEIYKLCPEAKIIIILRNPVDRAFSAYNYFKKIHREQRSIRDALMYEPVDNQVFSNDYSDFSYLEHGWYHRQVCDVFSIFNMEQCLILDFEELRRSPTEILSAVWRFLEISPFTPNLKPKNVTGVVRFNWVQKILTHTSGTQRTFMKKFVDPWLPIEKRQSLKKILREVNTKKVGRGDEQIPDDINLYLKRFYREEIRKLQQLLGNNYTERWLK